jgi:hypothetical protein
VTWASSILLEAFFYFHLPGRYDTLILEWLLGIGASIASPLR